MSAAGSLGPMVPATPAEAALVPAELEHAVVDVSDLPTATFGHRDVTWWVAPAFMLIEGTTLAIVAAAYFYLIKNSATWPPPGTPEPDLLPFAVTVGVMWLSCVPAALAHRAAKTLDLGRVRLWLIVTALFALSMIGLRWWEFVGLNTRWDANAYGSAVWNVLGFHALTMVPSILEIVVTTVMMLTKRVEAKHFSDVVDSAYGWYFVVASWTALAAIVVLTPKLI